MMMRLSRFPETGLAHAKNYVRGSEVSSGEGTYNNPLGANFQMRESIEWNKYKTELNRRVKQGFILGYVSADWFKEKLRIHSVGNNQNFKLVERSRYGFSRPSHIERFSIKNMLYELSHPGEWFFNKLDKRLYIYPYNSSPETSMIGKFADQCG